MNMYGAPDPMMQAYLEMERMRGDGPSTGNNFLGYGSLQGASDAILGPGRMQAPGMAPNPATMPQQGAQGMMPGAMPQMQALTMPPAMPQMQALTMPPANESAMAMSRRYAEALLGGASAPQGMQNVMNVAAPFSMGQQQPSQADLQNLIAAELMRQQPRQQQLSPQQMWAALFGGEGGNSAFGGGPSGSFSGGDPDSYGGGGFSGGDPDDYGG